MANFVSETRRPQNYIDELDKKEQLNFGTLLILAGFILKLLIHRFLSTEKIASSNTLSELDLKNGLRQLGECLLFLHTQVIV